MRQKYPIRILAVGTPDLMQPIFEDILHSTEFIINFATAEEFEIQVFEAPYHVCVLLDSVSEDMVQIINDNDLNKCFAVYILRSEPQYDRIVRYLIRDNQQVMGEIAQASITPIRDLMCHPISAVYPLFDINLDLDVELILDADNPQTFDAAATELLSQMSLEKLTDNFDMLVAQFEDLVCRVFHDCVSVTLKPLPAGYSGAGILQVQTSRKDNDDNTIETAPHILKFGVFSDLDKEFTNYKFFVNGVLYQGHAAYGQMFARTPSLGAILYTFVGNQDNNPFDDLQAVFFKHDIDHIETVLKDLFQKTCDGWYNQPEPVFTIDLTEEYRKKLSLMDVPQMVENVNNLEGITLTHDKISFDALALPPLPHPLFVLENQIFTHDTCRSVTHGDLHLHNILVSNSGTSWLIDFSHTGYGHILRDLASLDVSIRIALLGDRHASLEERHRLEVALLQAREFSDIDALTPPDDFSPLLQKIFCAVCTLRKLAYEFVKQNASSRLHEYYVSLFYYSVRGLKYRNLSSLQHLHVLLSAALIIDRIRV